MGILLDLILVAIVLLNVIIGYKKGLVNVVFNIFAFLIAIIVTLLLFKPISNIVIGNTKIDDKIKETIIVNMSGNENEDKIETETKENNVLQTYIESKIKEKAESAKTEALDVIAQSISVRATEILTAILLFIALRVVLIILKFLTEFLEELPIIKQFNKAGGLLYGVLKATIIILLLSTVLYLVASVKPDGIISSSIKESYITKFLYQNNIIIKYCLLGKNLL